MKKTNNTWSIKELLEKIDNIEFPEYQREATVWDIIKKRKLIDSILRNIDIASIYLYKREDGDYECIDGSQRINAIISFLGLNEGNEEDTDSRYHNNFKFKSSDELLGIASLNDFDNKTWKELAKPQQQIILDYQLNVLEITDIDKDKDKDKELNLMFLRLQLGSPLNAGEKLNAMVGDMKEFIFKTTEANTALGEHLYFDYLMIPKRRFYRQLTAAQIAINFFSLEKTKEYKRARFIDLQEFFKTHVKFLPEHSTIGDLLRTRLDKTYNLLKGHDEVILNNRAIGVSVFFFINNLIASGENSHIEKFIEFLKLFLKKLKEQVEKGIDIELQYRDLLKFQTYISQAAVEKYAIENRQKILKEYFDYYLSEGKIKGDS